jgi:biopolymer transport protein ExbD
MPEVNMIPMMGVMLVVLAFFVYVSMTLRSQQSVNVSLPVGGAGAAEVESTDPLVVGLNKQGQLLVDGKIAGDKQLADRIIAYLKDDPRGTVILKADREVEYRKVLQMLRVMQEIGGDRVSLAIQQQS